MEFLLHHLHDFFVSVAHAQGQGIDALGDGQVGSMWEDIRATFTPYNSGQGFIFSLFDRIVTIVRLVVGTAAVLAIVYAGIQVASSGADDKIAEAKKTITYALVGIMIVALGPIILVYFRDVILPLMAGG
jgi:hypothetical protein